MKNNDIKSVSAYIKNAPREAQSIMEELRALIIKSVPEATEEIAWGVPIYKTNGVLAGFDNAKQHVSFGIDSLTPEVRETLKQKGYKTGSKTVQIKFDQKVPTAILKSLLKAQVKTNVSKK